MPRSGMSASGESNVTLAAMLRCQKQRHRAMNMIDGDAWSKGTPKGRAWCPDCGALWNGNGWRIPLIVGHGK